MRHHNYRAQRLLDTDVSGVSMRGHKYHAKATVVDGIRFASKKESKHYIDLLWRRDTLKEIKNLELQPKYPLGTDDKPVLMRSDRYPNGRRASYIADFSYVNLVTGKHVVEDVKGMDTPLSKLKRAVVEAQYGIRIVLV
jgi:hypothetical protein